MELNYCCYLILKKMPNFIEVVANILWRGMKQSLFSEMFWEDIKNIKIHSNFISLLYIGRAQAIEIIFIEQGPIFLPGRGQTIIWTNAGILPIGPLGKKINEILIKIQQFSSKKMRLKMLSAKCRPCMSRPQCVNPCTVEPGYRQHYVNSLRPSDAYMCH